jgi:translation elongation factor P/translation initiation factor 5A
MDTTSFEEVQLSRAVLGDKSNWLLEGATIEALKWTVRTMCNA